MALTKITSKQVTYKQGGTGSEVRNLGDKLRESVHVFDFMTAAEQAKALAGDVSLDATTAVSNAIAAVRDYGVLHIDGLLPIDPITITKPIYIRGNALRQTVSFGGTFAARGNQTHILMIKGGAGTFPTDFIDGLGLDYVTFYGQNYAISDAALVFWNCGMLNSIGLNITNVVGSAIRFKNAQDYHFVSTHISDVGDNANEHPMLVADPTSSNNVNNIYFTDFHFESVAWWLWTSSNTSDDAIVFNTGKVEHRLDCAGVTSANTAYGLVLATGVNRFTWTNSTVVYTTLVPTESLFKFTNGIDIKINNNHIKSNSTISSDFAEILGTISGYVIENNIGYNIPTTITNTSSKFGITELPVWSNNNASTNKRAILDAVSPPIDRMVSNAGGNFAYGVSGSYTGKSLTYATISEPIGGIRVPIGYPKSIKVTFRLYSDLAGRTVALGYRTVGAAYTAVRTGVAVSNSGFGNVDVVLTPTMLTTAVEVVVVKEQADDNLYIDGAWIDYSDSFRSYAVTWSTASGAAPVLGNGTLVGEYKQDGDTVFANIYLLGGSTTTYGGGSWQFSLPVAPDTTSGYVGTCYISDTGTGETYGFPAVRTTYVDIGLSVGVIGTSTVSNTVPMTWVAGDFLKLGVIYKAA